MADEGDVRTENELLAEIAANTRTIRVVVQWAFLLTIAAALLLVLLSMD